MQRATAMLGRVWASPYTLLGLLVGSIGVATGGGWQRRRGVVEFYGGATRWLLNRVPIGEGDGALAMTLGHTILGQTEAGLDLARTHEHVHVRQFERWGPFMGPAYLLASLWVGLCRGQAYRDNPFEVEAFAVDDLTE